MATTSIALELSAASAALGAGARRRSTRCRRQAVVVRSARRASASASSDNEPPASSSTSQRAPGGRGTFAVGETVSANNTTLVIRSVLGRGSFGTTYGAEQPDGTMVAIKVLALRDMKNWKALELFEREAKTLKGLSHPAIPDYVDYFEIDTAGDVKFCLVQRIAPGESLQMLVDEGWRPTEAEVESVATQLLDVLGYLGSLRPPVAHRDVKPGNVLLDRASSVVSLVDFGATADAAVTAAVAEEAAVARAAGGGGGGRGGGFAVGSTMVGLYKLNPVDP